jgi:uncharacterized protein
MSLHQDIKSRIKDAMKAKDSIRLQALRNLSAAFTNEVIAKMRTPQEELSDPEALAVIKRLAKQRKDSIEQFKNAGRDDLVESEEAELRVLEEFLPQTMSKDEIKKVAEAKKAELAIADKSKIGMLMGAVMKELKDKADGGDVKAVVEELLQ